MCLIDELNSNTLPDLLKSNKIGFDLFESMNGFYKKEFENDKNVRKMWCIYCNHFLSKVSKEWNEATKEDRLRKKTLLYKHVTTSDEAIIQLFIKIWLPKLKEQAEKEWPVVPKSTGKGEQDIKKWKDEYIKIYNSIDIGKKRKMEHLRADGMIFFGKK
jgi:hypothetical protein